MENNPQAKNSTSVQQPSSPCLEAAFDYLARGWSVIPVAGDKRPLIAWREFQHRKATEAEIWGWFEKFPQAGVGIVCGKVSGLVVLDIDPRNGGDTTLANWSEKGLRLPEGPTAKTGSGGCHFYLRHPGGEVPTIPGLAPGIDLKVEGSYVLAPPSLHPSGSRYIWYPDSAPADTPLPQPPAWLRELIQLHRGKDSGVEGKPGNGVWRLLLAPIGDGVRNDCLTRIAGWLHLYHPAPVVKALLLVINEARCVPPLEAVEVERVASSVCKYPTPGVPGHPRAVVADFVRQEVKDG